MNLLLVQHGQAKTREEDPAMPLNADGERAVGQMARWLATTGTRVDEIRHSVKERARQTAAAFAQHLSPEPAVKEITGLKPMEDVLTVADGLKGYQGSLMLVGHLPFMSRLTGLLVTGDPEREVVQFRNAGVVCLSDEGGRWQMSWAVVPDLL